MNTKKTSKLRSLLSDTVETRSDTLNDLAGGFADTVKNDVLKGTAKDFWSQILSSGEYKSSKKQMSGDLSEGEEFHLPKAQDRYQAPEAAKRNDILPGFNYRAEIVHGGERLSMHEKREIQQSIAEIKAELERLMASANVVVQAEFAEIVVEQNPTSPGKYHLNFFEWMLSVIRIARMKVEDSGAWMAALSSKKKGKGYWQMFKKHGTTFGMSHERNVSTQTG